jgi:hypothetical protein
VSDDPLLSKMDALLRKHRGGPDAAADDTAPSANAWLPVLTDVIEAGQVPPVAEPEAPPPSVITAAAPPAAEGVRREPEPPLPVVNDTLAEQLMSELAPRLSQIMEKQVAAQLRKSLDETVAALIAQLDVNVREIVREAVAERLKAIRTDEAQP